MAEKRRLSQMPQGVTFSPEYHRYMAEVAAGPAARFSKRQKNPMRESDSAQPGRRWGKAAGFHDQKIYRVPNL
jgi:hypothetical protein